MAKRMSRWALIPHKEWVDSFETGLLYEDFRNRVLPFRDPDAYVLEGQSAPTFESLDLPSHSQGIRIDDFVREVATRLLGDHEVWIEVVIDDTGVSEHPITFVPVLGVKQTPGGAVFQELPSRSDLPLWYNPGSDWRERQELDPDRMIQIGLPEQYGSAVLSKVVGGLATIVPDVSPGLYLDQTLQRSANPAPFDIGEFDRTRRLRALQVALPIGWTAREILRGQNMLTTDYYHNWRELRFLHFTASMRSQAEEGIARAIALAKTIVDFDLSVTADRIYSPHQVELVMQRFERGEISFASVSDSIFEKGSDPSVGVRTLGQDS